MTHGAWRPAVLVAAALLVAVAEIAAAGGPGDAGRGAALFASKQCSRCHRSAGVGGMGPTLPRLRGAQGAMQLAGRLWNHAPAMFTAFKQEAIAWPSLSPAEMADIMAYLGASPALDPAFDRARGEVVLLQKGCLKCHRFRREGGRLGPDLSIRRPAYDGAAAWASAMWTHTPRMAATAMEHGILYPRFTGDEMVNLVGFLQSVAAAASH